MAIQEDGVSPEHSYLRAVYRKFKYFGTWLPGSQNLRLGDFGLFQGKRFIRQGSLADLHVPFTVRSGENPIPFSHTSAAGVSITTKLAGSALDLAPSIPKASAGVVVQFSQEHAMVFQIVGGYEDEIENKVALSKAIRAQYSAGQWEKRWVVIDRLVRADSFTMALSESSASVWELTAAASLPAGPINIGDASLGLSTSHKKGQLTEVLARSCVPMFGAARLKGLFSPRLDPLRPLSAGEEGLEALTFDDLE